MKKHFDINFSDVFAEAENAIRVVTRRYAYYNSAELVSLRRVWWRDQATSYPLHPVVKAIVHLHTIRPVDWHLLLLEWPHVSVDDDSMIAYTRDEKKGEADVQTKTSIGKYLARHWPHVPDHIRRDWAGAFGQSKFEIRDTKEGIISGVELGPQSCMRSSYGSIPFTNRDNEMLVQFHEGKRTAEEVKWDNHPYAVYAPEYGWRMAVRIDTGHPNIVMGRCLIHADHKLFVRSYTRGESDSSYSHTDEKLEHWLRGQGYNKRSSWPHGVQFRKVKHPMKNGLMMPYIDGDERQASDKDECIVLDGRGPTCDNTDATFDSRSIYGECECCGAVVYEDEDERIWAGQNGDVLIGGCCSDNYTQVRGDSNSRRGYDVYWLHDNDANYCSELGYSIDPENPPSNLVECEDGEYREEDDCVEVGSNWYPKDDDTVVECEDGDWRRRDDCVEVEGNWYAEEDESIVQCEDSEYRLRVDCWQCDHTMDWYSNDEASVELPAGTYHPDSLRSLADEA